MQIQLAISPGYSTLTPVPVLTLQHRMDDKGPQSIGVATWKSGRGGMGIGGGIGGEMRGGGVGGRDHHFSGSGGGRVTIMSKRRFCEKPKPPFCFWTTVDVKDMVCTFSLLPAPFLSFCCLLFCQFIFPSVSLLCYVSPSRALRP